MATTEQKKKLLKAKIAVALRDELGRVPKNDEIERVFLMARVMYKAVLGLHFSGNNRRKAARSLFTKHLHFSLFSKLVFYHGF